VLLTCFAEWATSSVILSSPLLCSTGCFIPWSSAAALADFADATTFFGLSASGVGRHEGSRSALPPGPLSTRGWSGGVVGGSGALSLPPVSRQVAAGRSVRRTSGPWL